MQFEKLMQPFQLKNLQLRNRIVMSPMLSRLCLPNGVVSQKLIDYYAERAKGGVGLIIVEYSYIDELESKAEVHRVGPQQHFHFLAAATEKGPQAGNVRPVA